MQVSTHLSWWLLLLLFLPAIPGPKRVGPYVTLRSATSYYAFAELCHVEGARDSLSGLQPGSTSPCDQLRPPWADGCGRPGSGRPWARLLALSWLPVLWGAGRGWWFGRSDVCAGATVVHGPGWDTGRKAVGLHGGRGERRGWAHAGRQPKPRLLRTGAWACPAAIPEQQGGGEAMDEDSTWR